MAEVQTNTDSAAEKIQIFMEFVMMQGRNAALFLGQVPDARNEVQLNLPLARMFIDQLAVIREKTRGNLTKDEQEVLDGTLSDLQIMFVEVAKQIRAHGGDPGFSAPPQPAPPESSETLESTPAPAAASQSPTESKAPEQDQDNKRRFTKSYGA